MRRARNSAASNANIEIATHIASSEGRPRPARHLGQGVDLRRERLRLSRNVDCGADLADDARRGEPALGCRIEGVHQPAPVRLIAGGFYCRISC